jgi:hypothetical protein
MSLFRALCFRAVGSTSQSDLFSFSCYPVRKPPKPMDLDSHFPHVRNDEIGDVEKILYGAFLATDHVSDLSANLPTISWIFLQFDFDPKDACDILVGF